ncbi:hypothetical protein VaNZ11_014071, partial [Volvox africanus]
LELLRLYGREPSLPSKKEGVAAHDVHHDGKEGTRNTHTRTSADTPPLWQYDFRRGQLSLLRFVTVSDLVRSWQPLADHLDAVQAPAIANIDVERLVLILADTAVLFHS